MSEPIQAVLISGEIAKARMCRALGELADISDARSTSQNPVVVVDSDGDSAETPFSNICAVTPQLDQSLRTQTQKFTALNPEEQ